jgi:hypothetical protein
LFFFSSSFLITCLDDSAISTAGFPFAKCFQNMLIKRLNTRKGTRISDWNWFDLWIGWWSWGEISFFFSLIFHISESLNLHCSLFALFWWKFSTFPLYYAERNILLYEQIY